MVNLLKMPYPKAEYINEILEDQTQLIRDLIRGGISAEDYLKRDRELDKRIARVGEAFDSLNRLESRILLSDNTDLVQSIVEQAEKRAALGNNYGIKSRFVYIAYDKMGLELIDDPENDDSDVVRYQFLPGIQGVVIIQYPNFQEKAIEWKLTHIIQFLARVAEIYNPSDNNRTNRESQD